MLDPLEPPVLGQPLIISAALTLWSMVHYLLAAWPHLSTTPKEK